MRIIASIVLLQLILACNTKTNKQNLSEKDSLNASNNPNSTRAKTSEDLAPFELFFPHFKCLDNFDFTQSDSIFYENSLVGLFSEVSVDLIDPECLRYFKLHPQFEGKELDFNSSDIVFDSINDRLYLKLANNRIDTFSNNSVDGEGFLKFEINNYFDFIDSYLITEWGWEGYHVLLINRQTNQITYLKEIPEFNPQKDLFFTNCCNGEDGNCELSIYSIQKNNIKLVYKLEWQYNSYTYLENSYNPIWIDNTTLLLRDEKIYTDNNVRYYITRIINLP